MKLTNVMRLPEPIVAAISNDSYTKGDADFSVTELLTPPQVVRLRKQHANEIVEDVSERIWSLLGQAVHSIIERAGDSLTTLSETTLYSKYNGVVVKGQVDHIALDSGTLIDFKVTTVWKLAGGSIPLEWEQQTNIYRRMLEREHGIIINQIAVIAILRDWSKREATRRQDYPQAQVVRLEIPLWSSEQADAFIERRIALHQLPDVECSDEDVWAKPTKYAVMRQGRQSAIRLYDTLADAEAHLGTLNGSHYIEMRNGEAVRCQSYCAAAPFCKQWANDARNTNGVYSLPSADLFDMR
jgi:hypothetical protein